MKKVLLLSLIISIISITSVAYADYTGAGYYRIKNYKTERYASVVDNFGRIDFANTSADLQAVELHKNFENVSADPASVLYIYPAGNGYQIEAQGTGIYQIIQHYLLLKESGSTKGNKLYNAYGQMDGVIKYLGDSQLFSSYEEGCMATTAKGDYIKWYISPIDVNSDNFLGIKPTVKIGNKHYTTNYTSFPYVLHSEGMKAYYVGGADAGKFYLEEISGTVPANTPVLIECSSESPSSNRLNLDITNKGTQITKNKLNGVFFCCSKGGKHINRVAFDKNTMRVLGTCKDGSLGFIIPENLDYIPANECYITVSPGSPEEFKLISKSEFFAGIDDMVAEQAKLKDASRPYRSTQCFSGGYRHTPCRNLYCRW